MTNDALATSEPVETDDADDLEIVGEDDDDDLEDAVDGEAVVVPGQRPGPTDAP